jgi:hypothetical protein
MKSIITALSLLAATSVFAADAPKAAASTPVAASAPKTAASAPAKPAKNEKKAEVKPEAKK